MKIKANGITINYQIDGPDNAPCLVFSNSLATSLAMWDEQAAALKDSVPRVALRPARPRLDRRTGGALCLRYAACRRAWASRRAVDQEGAFCRLVDGRRHRARTCRASCRPFRPHYRLRFAVPIDAAIEPAMGRAHRGGAETGHRGAGRANRFALGAAGNPGEESAARRQNPRHDPRHAGQRLHRLRRGARRPRLRLRRRHA